MIFREVTLLKLIIAIVIPCKIEIAICQRSKDLLYLQEIYLIRVKLYRMTRYNCTVTTRISSDIDNYCNLHLLYNGVWYMIIERTLKDY